MHPIITDTDTGHELWTVNQCATHCGISTSTWRVYIAKKMPPDPVTQLNGRTPLWDAEEVKTWHANRPGSPVPNHPTARR